MKRIRSVLGFVVLSAACSRVAVQVPVTHPAEINLRGKQEIALGDVTGQDKGKLQTLLKQELTSSGFFKMVDRTHLDKVLRELSLSASDLANPDSRRKLGKMMTGSILVVGNVDTYNYEENTSFQKETCAKSDGKGKSYNYECTKYSRQGIATVTAGFDVIDVETGENLKPKLVNCREEKNTYETDGTPDHIDGPALLAKCAEKTVKDFMKAIAPWKEMVKVTFLKDGDLPTLEAGITYAKQGQWDDAIKNFQTAIEAAQSQTDLAADTVAKAHWNLGLAYEYTSDFDKAKEHVKKAYDMTQDEDFLKELSNIDRLREEHRKLQEQIGEVVQS